MRKKRVNVWILFPIRNTVKVMKWQFFEPLSTHSSDILLNYWVQTTVQPANTPECHLAITQALQRDDHVPPGFLCRRRSSEEKIWVIRYLYLEKLLQKKEMRLEEVWYLT